MDNETDSALTDAGEPPGTWLVPVTARERCVKVVAWVVPTYALTAWLFYLQFQPSAREPYMLWGFALFAFGTFMGVRAFGQQARRVFDSVDLQYTRGQRIKRAARWLIPAVLGVGLVWGVQASNDQFATYWWYAWPALFPLLVGLGLYLLRSERVLSASGQYARGQIDAQRAQIRAKQHAKYHELAGSAFVRYVGAAACLYIAYFVANDSSSKGDGWAALIWVIFAFVLARELSVWLIGIALMVAVGWAMFAGISSLPVSVAVIIGALIIASAVSKK